MSGTKIYSQTATRKRRYITTSTTDEKIIRLRKTLGLNLRDASKDFTLRLSLKAISNPYLQTI